MEIKIRKSVKLGDLDSYYREIDKQNKYASTIDLCLPIKINNYHIGLAASLIQLVSTWVRCEKYGKLLLDIENLNEDAIEEISKSDFLFPVIALVWNSNGVYNKTGLINLRPELRSYLNNFFKTMKKVDVLKGLKIVLVNCDHFEQSRGLLPIFENNLGFNSLESVFESLKPKFESILRYNNSWKEKNDEVISHLIFIVYELMKNTFQWGKLENSPYESEPNIRGMTLRFYKFKRADLINSYDYHKGLLSYFNDKRLIENSLRELYFLELSVFDSGVGYVKKYKEFNKTDNNNVEVVKECLIKHNTSAIGMEKADRGRGLDSMLQLLNGKGFLRIKTGDVCIYRNMLTHKYKPIEKGNADMMEVYDWSRHSSAEFSTYPNAQGSLITILYPLIP